MIFPKVIRTGAENGLAIIMKRAMDIDYKIISELLKNSKVSDMELGKKGGEIDLTSEQREELQWLTDDTVIKGLQSLIVSPAFQGYTDEQKTEAIRTKMAKLRAGARAEYRSSLKAQRRQQLPGSLPPPTLNPRGIPRLSEEDYRRAGITAPRTPTPVGLSR